MNTLKNKKTRFGITLSGGGARGIAHIGVLEALEKYGIGPEIISGTSMGALVGVFYAAGFSPRDILEIVTDRKFHQLISWHLPMSGLVDIENILSLMKSKIGSDDFSALEKPFYCVVANLNSGEAEYVSEGELFKWVLASISIPVIFEPQVIDGMTYVDGGLLDNLPAKPLRNRCDVLIGVNVNHNGPQDDIKGMKTIAERCFRLGIARNITESRQMCDFIIEPPDTRKYSTFAFNKAEEIYRIGFNYTEEKILKTLDFIDLDKMAEMKRSKIKTKS